jgi:cytochrome c biogenesis protein ResB
MKFWFIVIVVMILIIIMICIINDFDVYMIRFDILII